MSNKMLHSIQRVNLTTSIRQSTHIVLFLLLSRVLGFIINRIMSIHQVLRAYYRGAAAARCHLRIPVNKRSWINAAGRALMVSRVFSVALSFVRIILYQSTPPAGALIKPTLFAPSHLFPDGWTTTCFIARLSTEINALKKCRRRMKSAWPTSSRRNLLVLSGNEVEITPWWMTMMSRASWKRGPAGETGLLIIIKRTVPETHNRARMNVARANNVRTNICVRRCTHDRIRISAIGKSSEPFITLILTLILNVASVRIATKRCVESAPCLFHRCKKFMNKTHLHASHRHSGPHRTLSSRQSRHAFRAHWLIFHILADRILLCNYSRVPICQY